MRRRLRRPDREGDPGPRCTDADDNELNGNDNHRCSNREYGTPASDDQDSDPEGEGDPGPWSNSNANDVAPDHRRDLNRISVDHQA